MSAYYPIAAFLAAVAAGMLLLRFRHSILRGATFLALAAIGVAVWAGIMLLAAFIPFGLEALLVLCGLILGGSFYLDAKREAERKEAEEAVQAIKAFRAEHGIKLPYEKGQ